MQSCRQTCRGHVLLALAYWIARGSHGEYRSSQIRRWAIREHGLSILCSFAWNTCLAFWYNWRRISATVVSLILLPAWSSNGTYTNSPPRNWLHPTLDSITSHVPLGTPSTATTGKQCIIGSSTLSCGNEQRLAVKKQVDKMKLWRRRWRWKPEWRWSKRTLMVCTLDVMTIITVLPGAEECGVQRRSLTPF